MIYVKIKTLFAFAINQSHDKDVNFDPQIPNENILRVLDWAEIFGNGRDVEVDLGAGDGGFILQLAKDNPEINYLAVERLLGRFRKILKRAGRENLTNLRGLRLESGYVIERMCPARSLAKIHIMFPDPWPKRRHHKNRLIQTAFIQACHCALKPGGEVRFTTDHREYFDWAQEMWEPEIAKGQWEHLGEWDFSNDPLTDFQKDFAKEGRPTYRCAWRAIPFSTG